MGILLTGLMGVALGLLGGGGSILAVPILVYVFQVDPHAAIALSLVIVGSTALGAALLHHRAGCVDWKGGVLFAACAAPLSLVGARAAMQVPGGTLLFCFGVLMLVAGSGMIFRRENGEAAQPERKPLALVLCGAGVGYLTGFLGVGGGFVIVPALVLFLGKEMKQAIGTSLFVIALNCAIALYGHRAALQMQWGVVLPSAGAALAGMAGGAALSRRIHGPALRRAFGVFVIVLGVFMAARNFASLQQ